MVAAVVKKTLAVTVNRGFNLFLVYNSSKFPGKVNKHLHASHGEGLVIYRNDPLI